MKQTSKIKKLSQFLIKAKIHTYASSGEGGETVREDGSKQLTYKSGEFKYRDRYFGFNPFIGEEIVWRNEKIIWGMNYYGEVISNKVSPKKVYRFLQKALRKVPEQQPFRGPSKFREGNFEYINEAKGEIRNFSGIEKIFYKEKEIYRLKYHGGFIKKL